MTLKPVVCFFFILVAGASFAQSGVSTERSALRNIEKHRWRKAEAHLRKSLEKDSINALARYLFGRYYFEPENPAFALELAGEFAMRALDDYAHNPRIARSRLMRIAADSAGLVALKASIDSTAFALAQRAHTEAAYQEFLDRFPSAAQRSRAIAMRDAIAFARARADNTVEAFGQFLERYPQAAEAPEARARYERLLYERETADGHLETYQAFLSDHPETPYREEIQRHIFQIVTADGTPECFSDFMQSNPGSPFLPIARRMLFCILAEEEDPVWPDGFLTDSLRHLLAVNAGYLVPVLQNGRYGFIDKDGHTILEPRFRSIHHDYLCGYITDDVLQADDALMTRSGSRIYEGEVVGIRDLGIGLLRIETPEGVKLIHKGGFIVVDHVDDVQLLDSRYVVVNRGGGWQLLTLTGRPLDNRKWDAIGVIGRSFVFERDGKKYLAPQAAVFECSQGSPLRFSEPLDEVKVWRDGQLWGRSGAFEGVMDQSLQRIIGFDQHVLTRTFFGATAEHAHGYTLYDVAGNRSASFEAVNIIGKNVAVKRNGIWFPFDIGAHAINSAGYDSLMARGPFMVGHRGDSVYVFFGNGKRLPLRHPLAIDFLPGMDAASFLIVTGKRNAKSVYDLEGNRLFTASFDAIEYAGKGVFVITRKGLKGLLDMKGEALLPVEFEAVGSAKDDRLSLLKGQRFGAYNIARKQYIRPQYERNLRPYTHTVLTTFSDGHYGFLQWDNKQLSEFIFDEIRYWDDSVALVKSGSRWQLYNIFTGQVELDNLRKVTVISHSDTEKVAIVERGNLYGVISNRRHEVIPMVFTHIINVGSAEAPLYFTETYVEEAGLFIVIYYDRHGKLLRKEIYDDATDYDKICCLDN